MNRGISYLLAVCLINFTGAALAQATDFDIVGLKMGMTEEEAIAALEAYEPGIQLTLVEGFFNYTDGVSHFESDSFLSEIRGTLPGSNFGEDFILQFTPPPNGGRLWLIDRREEIKSNFPSIAQYGAALSQKYGEPTLSDPSGMVLAWDTPAGAPACLRDRGGPAAYYQPRRDTDLLFRLQYMQQKGQAPADLSTCAVQLHYRLGSTSGDVVNSFNALMIDVGRFTVANDAANAQIEALEAEARSKRESAGEAPKL